ncbi:MAG: hypothetical protein JWO62_387 [Acidimicrobiaceae bacterium]|jgi:hypothetical protein|nr:hypothetical protein [Acidimicrobiaceae bacterium]
MRRPLGDPAQLLPLRRRPRPFRFGAQLVDKDQVEVIGKLRVRRPAIFVTVLPSLTHVPSNGG